MTKKRNDAHSTEFGIWLREQTQIDSSLGFVATNVDYIWKNYKSGAWMLIEEKRHGAKMKLYQKQLFETLHNACKSDTNYKGFYFVQFENKSPEDGSVTVNGKELNKEELISFLRFKHVKEPGN